MKYDEMLNGGLDLGMTLNTMEGKKFEKNWRGIDKKKKLHR